MSNFIMTEIIPSLKVRVEPLTAKECEDIVGSNDPYVTQNISMPFDFILEGIDSVNDNIEDFLVGSDMSHPYFLEDISWKVVGAHDNEVVLCVTAKIIDSSA